MPLKDQLTSLKGLINLIRKYQTSVVKYTELYLKLLDF